MICKAVRLHLCSEVGVTTLVGFRITPEGEGQGTALPRITYLLVDDVSMVSHSGPSGLAVARVQLNLLAADETQAAALAEQVRMALVGRKGFWGGMRIDSVFSAGTHGGYESDPQVYKRIMDFKITHTEAVA